MVWISVAYTVAERSKICADDVKALRIRFVSETKSDCGQNIFVSCKSVSYSCWLSALGMCACACM